MLVAAVGRPRMVQGGWVKEGAVVVDVGINRTDDGLVGDVDFDAAAQRARLITPVPRRRGADDDRHAAAQHARGRPRPGGRAGLMRRLRDGEWLAARRRRRAARRPLPDWYGGLSAWRAQAVLDVLSPSLRSSRSRSSSPRRRAAARRVPVALSVLTAARRRCSPCCSSLFRMADQPGPDALRAVHGGAWLGLAAARAC